MLAPRRGEVWFVFHKLGTLTPDEMALVDAKLRLRLLLED